MSQKAYKEAMEELETIEKSQTADSDPQEELDELTKSLEEELGEDLHKSKDSDADDKDGDSDPLPEDDKDEDDLDKSDGEEFGDELIKASEAYASLEKSVNEFGMSVSEELDTMRKSMAALMNLNIKQAKVIASLAKSIPEMGAITKSMADLASQPTSPSKAILGIKDSDSTEPLQKSISEVTGLLTAAVSAGKIDARHLSVFGTYKDVTRLPKEVQTIIGL